MTAVNCILTPRWVAVATDTLSSDPVDWGPGTLTPKAQFLPTARALFAVTGGGLLLSQAIRRATDVSPTVPEELRAHLPVILREAHLADITRSRGVQPDEDYDWESSGRVYVFGWSEQQARFIGDVYAATASFEPEPLEDGVYANPPILTGADGVNPITETRTALDACALVPMQQAEELKKPLLDQNLIGGHVMLYTLSHFDSPPDGQDPIVMQVRRMAQLPGLPAYLEAIRRKANPPPPSAAEWDRCTPWLAAALATDNGERSMGDLRSGYFNGRYLLFPGVRSAALAEGVTMDGVLHAHFYLAGGELGEVLDVLRPWLEAVALRSGCASIYITGRKGWARALRSCGYQLVGEINATRNWWLVKKALWREQRPASAGVSGEGEPASVTEAAA